jgi:hypothetical protein
MLTGLMSKPDLFIDILLFFCNKLNFLVTHADKCANNGQKNERKSMIPDFILWTFNASRAISAAAAAAAGQPVVLKGSG